MLTRCAYCGATFRVTPEQLKVRQGQVRCGKCRRVFDALRGLVENAPSTAAPTAPRGSDSADSPRAFQKVTPATPRENVAPPPDVPGLSWTIVVPAPPGAKPRPEPDSDASFGFVPTQIPESKGQAELERPPDFEPLGTLHPEPVHFEPIEFAEPELRAGETPQETQSIESAVGTEPRSDLDETPAPKIKPHRAPTFEPEPGAPFERERVQDFEPVHFHAGPPTIVELHEDFLREPRLWPWVVGCVLAAILFAAQILLHYRTEIIAAAPDTKPVFTTACALLGCQIALPHKIDLIGIESSDLAPDVQKPGTLYLTATLRNRATFAQTWPHLEITLTDGRERPLVRRTLTPDEFLPTQDRLAGGFARRSEQPIQLTLSAPGVPAVGYRLYVYYP